MGRPSLTRNDYLRIGREKGLLFKGTRVPVRVQEQTDWECVYCGTIHRKSLRAVQYGEFGCTCQNNRSLKPEDYVKLATELGITWVGSTFSNRVPRNTKTPTIWQGRTGELVEASYQELGYGNIRAELRRSLGLPAE